MHWLDVREWEIPAPSRSFPQKAKEITVDGGFQIRPSRFNVPSSESKKMTD